MRPQPIHIDKSHLTWLMRLIWLLIGWILLYLSPWWGLCGVSLNKNQNNLKHVNSKSYLRNWAAENSGARIKKNKKTQTGEIFGGVSDDEQLIWMCRIYMCRMEIWFNSCDKWNATRRVFFPHFITLLQTRSKGGPLLAGEDDPIILKRNQETNVSVWSTLFR